MPRNEGELCTELGLGLRECEAAPDAAEVRPAAEEPRVNEERAGRQVDELQRRVQKQLHFDRNEELEVVVRATRSRCRARVRSLRLPFFGHSGLCGSGDCDVSCRRAERSRLEQRTPPNHETCRDMSTGAVTCARTLTPIQEI